ncbi:secreted protein [Melampsora americana]|nr:secreted protein [Melampsora americana]
MITKFTFVLLVLQFMSTFTVISGTDITCDAEFRKWIRYKGIRHQGEFCVEAKSTVPKGTKIPTADTPKPYGFGCAEAADKPQSLFCNAIVADTIPKCDSAKCKKGDKRQPPIINWK